jgi:ElaB/YqjD/DUF883 family membrane-anchored ribosome-binding protein
LHRADTYVRENPVPTIVGALAVGFLIGLLVHSPEPTPRSRWNGFRDKADDTQEDLKHLLEAIAKKSKKAYKKSSHSVRETLEDAAKAAHDIDLDDYTDPVTHWFRKLWKKVS